VLAASLSVEGIFSDRVQLKESIVKGVDEELARFGTTVGLRCVCAAHVCGPPACGPRVRLGNRTEPALAARPHCPSVRSNG